MVCGFPYYIRFSDVSDLSDVFGAGCRGKLPDLSDLTERRCWHIMFIIKLTVNRAEQYQSGGKAKRYGHIQTC
ncbi:MAG: hypothetical protein KME26_28435 [Oscillatoria princeps RMCB-10]|nr:hypothetical protein [Oscillatoria princeps RMCB-10]